MSTTLSEIRHTRQVPGEPHRRWFSSDTLDLIVWLDAHDAPIGFQLCYDKLDRERALTWRAAGHTLTHMAVDDGESTGLAHKATPILVPDGALDAPRLLELFSAASSELPSPIRACVLAQLRAASDSH